MIYFDTDVLIHYLVKQDSEKHLQATRIYEKTTDQGLLFVSFLCLQEAAFVLSKLKTDTDVIDSMIDNMLPYTTVNYSASQFLRGKELARKIGFQNTNDCLHTAIAETHCTELVTFNKSDFKRIQIQKHTKQKITIL